MRHNTFARILSWGNVNDFYEVQCGDFATGKSLIGTQYTGNKIFSCS